MSLEAAVSGLLTYQRALATTSHNIANVNNDDYSRQRVDLSARTPQQFGNGFVGKGVQVTATRRIYDEFLVDQVTMRTSTSAQLDSFYKLAVQLDAALSDPQAGLSPALNQFFNAVQDVASNPTSTSARQVLISEAETLSDRFKTLDGQIRNLNTSVNHELETSIQQVNNIAGSIAELNKEIVRAQGAAGGAPPNDLLDQRDGLVRQLSEFVNVSSNSQSDGSLNVFVGNGQALVLGGTANTLATLANRFDVTKKEIAFVNGSSYTPITSQLNGGTLGGLIDVRTEILDVAQASLGRLAMTVASQFNTQHQLGDDLSGNAGGLFFDAVDVSAPRVLPSTNNNPASGSISVGITDLAALEVSDYQLNYDGANFSLVRLSDGVSVDSGFAVGDLPRTVTSEGIQISLTGSVSAGDSFLLQPTRNAASQMGVAISNTADIAAASSGSAVGNNDNALALAALQTQRSLDNGVATYQEAFGQLIADVGVKTNRASVAGEAQHALLNQAIQAKQSVSGVNLDEEAANLLKYQQAYQASAQVVSAFNNIFQVLINAVGR